MTKWNSGDIRLRDLTVLSVVLECLSLTRAAEALGTTQSSVSKVLARLRVRFGDPLLLRSGQSMRPTPKALEIAARCASSLRRPTACARRARPLTRKAPSGSFGFW